MKSRSKPTSRFSQLESTYSIGQCWFIDPKQFSVPTKLGHIHAFIAVELITGFIIDFYTKRLDAKSVKAVIIYIHTMVNMRFSIKIKLIVWDSFSTFIGAEVRCFAAAMGIELKPLPPYLYITIKRNRLSASLQNCSDFT